MSCLFGGCVRTQKDDDKKEAQAPVKQTGPLLACRASLLPRRTAWHCCAEREVEQNGDANARDPAYGSLVTV